MPTDIWKIPLDSDGCVRGSYYLRHATDVTDTLGVIQFDRGRSVGPVTGQVLVHFVAVLGSDVDLEPADDEARAAMGVSAPVAAAATVPEPVIATATTEPAPALPEAEPEPGPKVEHKIKHGHGKR